MQFDKQYALYRLTHRCDERILVELGPELQKMVGWDENARVLIEDPFLFSVNYNKRALLTIIEPHKPFHQVLALSRRLADVG